MVRARAGLDIRLKHTLRTRLKTTVYGRARCRAGISARLGSIRVLWDEVATEGWAAMPPRGGQHAVVHPTSYRGAGMYRGMLWYTPLVLRAHHGASVHGAAACGTDNTLAVLGAPQYTFHGGRASYRGAGMYRGMFDGVLGMRTNAR